MKALILNGAGAAAELAAALEAAVRAGLAARGYEVAAHDLTAMDVPDCKGDFGCWTLTPGVCVQPGRHREVARDFIQSDVAVWISPVTFGGYSSALKRHLDHFIPLIPPWFKNIGGETHHPPRYARRPRLLVLGIANTPDPVAAAVFDRVARRNAMNFQTPVVTAIVSEGDRPRLETLMRNRLEELERAGAPTVCDGPLDLDPVPGLAAIRPKRALLFVGSPRGEGGVSATLAHHLAAELQRRGLGVQTERVHPCMRRAGELGRVIRALEAADVVALLTPLYIDSLPGPVMAFLEEVARSRAGADGRPTRFLAVVNCGFPEAVHADTALAICRLFAAQARLDWLGGLAVGAGGMFAAGAQRARLPNDPRAAGKPLAKQGGQARHLVRAFALTADALERGEVVPQEARRLARTLPIPAALFRVIGTATFLIEGKRHGMLLGMNDRPYERSAP